MSGNCRFESILRNTVSAVALVAGCGVSGAIAQTAGGDVEQVVVTGSRLSNTGFSAPTPVTEISPIQYETKAITSMDDILVDVPVLTPMLNINTSTNIGTDSFNIHGLGATRTLVLVDNIRTEQTNANGAFDIGTIPTGLVRNIDIVQGGASAAYGSDAVAGVVNVTLNTTLTGLKANISGGVSQYGDEITGSGSIAYGTDLFGGRDHIVIGGDYYSNSGTGYEPDRPWGKTSIAQIANPNCTTMTSTCFQQLIVSGVTESAMSAGGVIVSPGPLQYTQFGPGGVAEPFALGTFVGNPFMVGGDGAPFPQIAHIEPSRQRQNFLVHNTYDITDDVSAWAEFSYARNASYFFALPDFNNGNITVTRQNAFLPTSIAAIMDANKITSFLMGRANYDLGGPIRGGEFLNYGRNQDYQGAAGLKGKVGLIGSQWDWDLTAQYTSNNQFTQIGQNLIAANWVNSQDSLMVNGKATCRSTLVNPNNGCVPVNLFGPNTVTQGVRDYAVGTSWTNAYLTQFLAGFNVRGEPVSTWAGPVSVAMGGEIRRQTNTTTADPISATNGWQNANQIPYKGALDVQEGYFETDVPLAKGLPLVQALDVDAAVRLTSYSTTGGVTTWKVGINYSPTDEIRLRGTRSHDIRAPNLTELFQAGNLGVGGRVTDPRTGQQVAIQTITQGNPNLTPEIGDNITAGAVYSPGWLEGFNISIDYWNVRVSKAITAATVQQVVNNCFAGQANFCSGIINDPVTGLIGTVSAGQYNAALIKTDGVDLEAGYNFQMDDVVSGWDGSMQVHLLGTYLDSYIASQFGTVYQEAGCVDQCSLPHLRYDLNAIYINDPWQIALTMNWMGGGEISYLYSGRYTTAQAGQTINNNKVDGRFTFNSTVNYQWSEGFSIYGKVANIFNVAPPLTPSSSILPWAAISPLYDRIGRQFTIGVKANLN